MDLTEIQTAVRTTLDAMNRVYDPKGIKKVFDEVLLVSFRGNALCLDWHQSARSEQEIRASFRQDFKLIRGEVMEGEYLPGDFHFDTEADGSIFDSFIYLGNERYLVFNSIKLSMNEVKNHGDWIAAQPYFVTLAAKLGIVFPE
ncbi:MAG: hypothetical protein PHN60_00245 [Candidatus Gracilibacteria bacterium]|nr:hypothetical protein [Candidatus Gracilibacteria bacterium]